MEATTSQTFANVIVALAPAFASGFAVQQGLQIVDPIVELVGPTTNKKRTIMGLLSFALGLIICAVGHLQILSVLTTATGGSGTVSPVVDITVSALFISGGTEGFNSIMKFLNYQKEAVKGDAAIKQASAAKTPVPASKAAALGNL